MIDRQARGAARSRHPSASGWQPDLARFTRHMTQVFAREGRLHPSVATALMSARGAAGDSLEQWSARTGVPSGWLVSLEAGDVEAACVPTAITEAAPWIDWQSLQPGAPEWVDGAERLRSDQTRRRAKER